MTTWELIFLQSKANNGAYYDDASLPDLKWDWPRETWLQERLRYLRKLRSSSSQGQRDDSSTMSPRAGQWRSQ
jgi:hypothetical protein